MLKFQDNSVSYASFAGIKPSRTFFLRLESESSRASDDDDNDTESICSIQDKATDFARDTSDTDADEYEVEIEYEVATDSENDGHSIGNSTDSEVTQDIVLAAAAAICDSSFEMFTDAEDSDSSMSSIDQESCGRTDFWTCVQCKAQNDNPLFRYCDKCFQDRKTFYPPRPRRHRKPKTKTKPETKTEERKTIIDIYQSRKRQLSESSLSEVEVKRPKRSKKVESETLDLDSGVASGTSLETASSVASSIASQNTVCSEIFQDEIEVHQVESSTSDIGSSIDSLTQSSQSTVNSQSEVESKSCPEIEDSQKSGLSETREMCMFCNTTPKNSIFLHGRIAHMCCCYKCAMRTWKTIKRCPICNRTIHNVVKVFFN